MGHRKRLLGDIIREARLERGLTQEQVAEHLNLKRQSTVSAWEGSKSRPSSALIVPLAKLLGLDVELLLEGRLLADTAGVAS